MATLTPSSVGDSGHAIPPIPTNQTLLGLSKLRTVLILGILFLASLIGALDSTIVTTLTRTIMSEVKSSSVVSWLGASYLIATALIQPLCGQFSDVYTRKACFFVGSLTFLLGNVTCSVTTSLAFLVVGRSLSGIGGGILTIMPTIILTDITPNEVRGLWQGINNITFGSGHGLGGIFGGFMAHRWSWRGAFMSLVIPTLVILIGTTLIPEPARNSNQCSRMDTNSAELPISNDENLPLLPRSSSRRGDIDIVGATLLCIGLGLLLASTQQLNPGNSGLNLAMNSLGLVISFISLLGFFYHSVFMAKEPLLPLKLLNNPPSVGCLCLISFLSQFGFTISEFYLPALISLQEHVIMEDVGWCLVPLSGGAAAGSLLAGALLSKFKTSHLLLSSSAITCVGTIGIFLWTGESSARIWQSIFTFMWGVGFGGLATVSLVRLLENVQSSAQASATSLIYTSRSLGGALSLPMANFVFNTMRQRRFERLLTRLATSESRYDLLPHIHELAQALLAHQQTHLQIPTPWLAHIQDCEISLLAFLFMLPVVSSLITLLLSLPDICT